MKEKIDNIVKYLQSKNTTFTVSEINEISQILVGLVPKQEEVKKEEVVNTSTKPKK